MSMARTDKSVILLNVSLFAFISISEAIAFLKRQPKAQGRIWLTLPANLKQSVQ